MCRSYNLALAVALHAHLCTAAIFSQANVIHDKAFGKFVQLCMSGSTQSAFLNAQLNTVCADLGTP